MTQPLNLKESTILATVSGSRVLELHTEDSDVDIVGIGILPYDFRNSLNGNWEQTEDPKELEWIKDYCPEDIKQAANTNGFEGKIFNLKKFMTLAAKANPNILEPLFCDEKHILYITPEGKELRKHRNIFVSKIAFKSYAGYGFAQLKRMKRHREYLLNPPIEPTRELFGLSKGHRLLNREQLAAIGIISNEKLSAIGVSEDKIKEIRAEADYQKKRTEWKHFEDWRKNRNPKRMLIEDKCLYDSKNGLHLMRLLLTAQTLAKTGKLVITPTPEQRQYLLDIRHGNISYEEIMIKAEQIDEEVKQTEKDSTVPNKPNYTDIEMLYKSLLIQHDYLKKHKV